MTTKTEGSSATTSSLYEADFVSWLETTTQLIREQAFEDVDWANVLEELEALGRSEKHALESQMIRVLMHLLKWNFQPQRRSNSWKASITEGRSQLRRLLKASPSLKRYLEEVFVECYQDARRLAADETGLAINVFPPECPFTIAEVLDPEFLSHDEADS
jgi:hypothetical protein